MITHVVAFRWKPGIPAGHVEVITDALRALAAQVGTARSYACGADARLADRPNFDYAIVATFDDVDGWKAYDEFCRTAIVEPWLRLTNKAFYKAMDQAFTADRTGRQTYYLGVGLRAAAHHDYGDAPPM